MIKLFLVSTWIFLRNRLESNVSSAKFQQSLRIFMQKFGKALNLPLCRKINIYKFAGM